MKLVLHVIGFISIFSNFYLLELCNETCVAVANLPWWSISNNQIENWTSPDLVVVMGSAHLWIPKLNSYVMPILFIIKCGVINRIWRCIPSFFEHVVIWCLFFDPHLTTYQSNIGPIIKKSKYHSHSLSLNIAIPSQGRGSAKFPISMGLFLWEISD